MPILNFKKEFADLIIATKKRQTIRAMRENPIKVGDKLYLYTGLRTKKVVCLSEKLYDELTPYFERDGDIEFGSDKTKYVVCKEVHEIEMDISMRNVGLQTYEHLTMYIDGKPVDYNGMEAILIADGFKNLTEMTRWFQKVHGFPFKGQLIKW